MHGHVRMRRQRRGKVDICAYMRVILRFYLTQKQPFTLLGNGKTKTAIGHMRSTKHSEPVMSASKKAIIGLTRTKYYSCGAEMWESSSWYLSITSLEM